MESTGCQSVRADDGYLHEGHVSLMRKAATSWQRGVVVISIYINPDQFAPTETSTISRDLPRDERLASTPAWMSSSCRRPANVSAQQRKSAPTCRGILSRGWRRFAPDALSWCGHRVAKLFNIVRRTRVFGAKDFQQAAIVKRMGRDLNFPVKIIVAPTVREADGSR